MAWFRTDPQEVMKETVLWENPNPTSAVEQGVTMSLNQSYSDFDYIKIVYRLSTTNSTEHTAIYTKEDVDASVSNTAESRMGLQAYLSVNYARIIYRPDAVTENSFTISQARQLTGTGTSTTVLIPTQIIGIKRGIEVNPMFDLSLPPDAIYQNANMAVNATTTIAVTKMPKYIVATAINTSNTSYMTGIYNVEKDTAWRYGYFSSANQSVVWSTVANMFTSITSSAVSFKNTFGTGRVTVAIYY